MVTHPSTNNVRNCLTLVTELESVYLKFNPLPTINGPRVIVARILFAFPHSVFHSVEKLNSIKIFWEEKNTRFAECGLVTAAKVFFLNQYLTCERFFFY